MSVIKKLHGTGRDAFTNSAAHRENHAIQFVFDAAHSVFLEMVESASQKMGQGYGLSIRGYGTTLATATDLAWWPHGHGIKSLEIAADVPGGEWSLETISLTVRGDDGGICFEYRAPGRRAFRSPLITELANIPAHPDFQAFSAQVRETLANDGLVLAHEWEGSDLQKMFAALREIAPKVPVFS